MLEKTKLMDDPEKGTQVLPEIAGQLAASSSSSVCYDARMSVLALYGMAGHTLPTTDYAVSLSSSNDRSDLEEALEADGADEGEVKQVDDAGAAEAKMADSAGSGEATQAARLKYVSYTDSRKGVVVRDYGFRKEEAKMEPGPSGFATAVFENGDKEESEVPNAKS